jgi:AcrR family transcriptional regulator
MPKKVDHHERRTRIADALMRVAADRGLEAVSLRHVATEAGVTAGMVQHYFATKDQMMTFAVGVVAANAQARLTAAAAELGETPEPRALLRTMLAGMLPLDDARRADGRVALAFLAYAAVRPAVAEAVRRDTVRMHDFIADLIGAAQAAGDAGTGIDPAHAAAGLLAITEGLTLHLLGDIYPPQAGLAALDAHLDLLFSPA